MLWYKIVSSLIRINVSVCGKCSQRCSYRTQRYFGAFDLCAVFFSNCWKHHLSPLFLQPLFLPFSYRIATSLPPPFHAHPAPPSLTGAGLTSDLAMWIQTAYGQRCTLSSASVDHEPAVSAATCWPWTWRDWKWLPCWWSWSSSSRFWSGLACWQPATTVSKGGGDVFSREEPLVAEV